MVNPRHQTPQGQSYVIASIYTWCGATKQIETTKWFLKAKFDNQMITPTDLVHKELSLLKIDDIHIAKVLSFVNECRSCRVPDMFVNYYETRETGLNLRNRRSLDIPWARTDMGLSRCDIKGARLWNQHLQTTNQLLYKKCFHKQLSNALIRTYN